MKFTLTRWYLVLFIFLNQPTPTLPTSENGTYAPELDVEPFMYARGRRKMMDAEFKCYARMQLLPPYQGEGLYCNRTWDGWLCWDDTPAGVETQQPCPDYFPDFDPAEMVTKYCDENGFWFKHPESNKTWSNYSMCNAFSPEKLKNAYVLYYLAIVGHSVSLLTLTVSLGIFMYYKNLSCQRVTLHKHMFLTYVLNSIIIIIHLVQVVPKGEFVRKDPLICKILHFLHQYMMACNYFWMLCEGIYLHTLIVVTVFAKTRYMRWYYLLGWGFPLVPTIIHAVSRALYFNDNCWLSVETYLLYIIHGPVMAALVINFFFLLNIVRVLVKKMRETQGDDPHMYLKAVRATLILVPLLGIQFVVFPWRPANKLLGRIYDYVMHSLIHFQGFFVAVIYCFYNHDVQATLKRHWNQLKIQREQRWGYPNRRAPNFRAAAAAAAAAEAEAGGLPIYICHPEPRNLEPTFEISEQNAEALPMEVIGQNAEALPMEVIGQNAEALPMEVIGQNAEALPMEVIGQNAEALPMEVIGQNAEALLPTEVTGQNAEALLPTEVTGQNAEVLPMEVIGQNAEALLPTEVTGQNAEVLPTEVTGQNAEALPLEVTEQNAEALPTEVTGQNAEALLPTEVTEQNAEALPLEVTEQNAEALPTEVTEQNAEALPTEVTEQNAEALLPTEVTGQNAEALPTEVIGKSAEALPLEVIGESAEALPLEVIGESAEALPLEVIGESAEALPLEVIGESAEALPLEVIEQNAEALPMEVTGQNAEALPLEVIGQNAEALPTEVIGQNAEALPTEVVEQESCA